MTHGESIQTALEMIPKGEFLLTAAGGGRTNGVLVNFVGQCANNPPMLAVSAVKGQVLSPLIRDSRRFVLSIVSDHNRSMARRFDQSSIENEDAFLGLPIERTPSGVPVLSDSDAWFECELVRHLDIDADCELYVGSIQYMQLADMDECEHVGTKHTFADKDEDCLQPDEAFEQVPALVGEGI